MNKEKIKGIKINAHHPRETTLVSKNTMQTPVGECIARPQNTDILQNKYAKQLQKRVGAILIARKNKLQPLYNGITLISLVITIIILLILAGVTIALTMGENGIFGLAENAGEETNRQVATEKISVKITTAQMEKYAEKQTQITLKELSEALRDDDEIEYVTESSRLASAKYEVGENPSKIYTKLKEYPYEFQINSSLQIVSIDGKKLSESSNVTGGTIGESNIIEDIELIVSINNGEYIELTCNVKTVDNAGVAGYVFLLNDEVKHFCKENIVYIDDLTLDTNYTVSVMAVDKTGKIKKKNLAIKTENKVYLYKDGNECKHITNGWVKTGYHVKDWGTITKNDNSMQIYAPDGTRILCGTAKMIDLSKYSCLYIENEGGQRICQINTTNYFSNDAGTDILYTSKEKIDISSYNSQYYLHLTTANGGTAIIKNIWLEK